MKQPKNFTEYGKEGCCPSEWDHTPQITGDYEMDGSIQRCKNPAVRDRLRAHLAGDAYSITTGYTQHLND